MNPFRRAATSSQAGARSLRARLRAGVLGAALLAGGSFLRAAPTAETVTEFRSSPVGPYAALAAGGDGNFYGTTQGGGPTNNGTVFRVTPSGALTILVEFTDSGGSSPGRDPLGTLVLGPDGNFYGTTQEGGGSSLGTVFRVTPTGVLTTLVEFTGGGAFNRGSHPSAGLAFGSDGNFYGTTQSGGAADLGTVFRVSPTGAVVTLVEFTGNGAFSRGSAPLSSLVAGGDGNFYGTTSQGGASNNGTIFRVTPGGALSTLVEFTGNGASNRGGDPLAALVAGRDGNFYGTTQSGGASNYGTVFRVTSDGILTTLWEFTGVANQGRYPSTALVQGSDGSFYGATFLGGTPNFGTVFRITPEGVLTTLVEFTNNGVTNKGRLPSAALVQGSDGNFYGSTYQGGASNFGTVFRMTPAGVLTTLVDFALGPANSLAELLPGSDGNFYGTSSQGGALNNGAVFRLSPTGALATLVSFTNNGVANKGRLPSAGLVIGSDGNFYGTTYEGGASGLGTVFRMTPTGALTTLVEFTGSGANNRGSNPSAALAAGPSGDFYGTTSQGGASNFGTIFRLSPAGALTTLVDFTGTGAPNRGNYPATTLVLGRDGNFYGATQAGGVADFGTIFRLTPGGTLATLVEFTNSAAGSRGRYPAAALTEGSDGNFYGTTQYGGASDFGTMFRLTPASALTTLVEFTNAAPSKGRNPFAALTATSDGNFYGTTQAGGASNRGTVFRVTPDGALTTLVEFTGTIGPNKGRTPDGALRMGADGNLYGTTYQGGAANLGTVFRLRFGPTPVTLPASVLSPTSVTLNGSLNPNGPASTAFFEYGTSPATLTSATLVQNVAAGTGPMALNTSLGGLSPGTTYYFRLRGDSPEAFQPQRGEVLSFITPTGSPQLLGVTRDAGGTRVRWQDLPSGLPYRVQSNDDLLGAWQFFAGTVHSDPDGVIEFFDPGSPAQRFYRLVSAP